VNTIQVKIKQAAASICNNLCVAILWSPCAQKTQVHSPPCGVSSHVSVMIHGVTRPGRTPGNVEGLPDQPRCLDACLDDNRSARQVSEFSVALMGVGRLSLRVPFTAMSGSLCSPRVGLGLVHYSNQLEHSAARLSITRGCLRETRRAHRTFQQFILVFAYGDIIVCRSVWKPKGNSTQP